MMGTVEANCDAVIRLIDRTNRPRNRLLIGIAGPPGSGKSTLAEAVVKALNDRAGAGHEAALLPMDGFHLDNEELSNLGLLTRKGAPETFDARGLLDLLIRVRAGDQDLHYPIFDRALDLSITDAGVLRADTAIVVVEGNYLLLDSGPWAGMSDQFDATVFLKPSLATLEARLKQRWLDHGFTAEAADRKAHGNDLVNARLVLLESLPADLTLAENTVPA